MVLVKPSSTYPDRLLVGSDLADPEEARREVETWLTENEYHVPRNARQLSVFQEGVFVREWVLAERLEVQPTPIASPFARWFQRGNGNGARGNTTPNITILSDL
jgi:hypothetical protein